MTTTPPADALDVARLRAIIARSTWTFAKTHEYAVMGKGATRHDINTLTKAIREHGYTAYFGRSKQRYIAIDDHKYWGWGALVNRAKLSLDTPEQAAARREWEDALET
jgi:hypothetical protein